MKKRFYTDGRTVEIENYKENNSIHYGYDLDYIGDDENGNPIYEKAGEIMLTSAELAKMKQC